MPVSSLDQPRRRGNLVAMDANRLPGWAEVRQVRTVSLVARVLLGTLVLASGISIRGETVFWPLPGLEVARQRVLSLGCVNHLKQIGLAAQLWSIDNGDQVPAGFQVLTNELTSPAILFCPADVGRLIPTNWSDLDWSRIDYTWISNSPLAVTNICGTCRIHTHALQADGFIQFGTERSGWPAVVAGPIGQDVTPGSEVEFQVRIAPDALLPVSFQWRREQLYYTTNAIFVPDPDTPGSGYWGTNRLANFTVTNLAGQTNPSLSLQNVQTNDSDYYTVAVSNVMGTSVSGYARLRVDAAVSAMTTEHWSRLVCLNNLKQISLLAIQWAANHDEHMPQSLSEMTNRFGLPLFGWPLVLFCRSDTARTAPADWQGLDFAKTSYEIIPGDEQDPYAIFCRCKVHGFYAQMDGQAISGPRFISIYRANNSVELTLAIFAGRTNLLEASADFVNWTNLATYSGAPGVRSHNETTTAPRRFYRIRLPGGGRSILGQIEHQEVGTYKGARSEM